MQNNWKDKLKTFSDRLGYRFSKPELLHEALTHRSYNVIHNERLEFLGDSILNCAIADIIFEKFQNAPEGRLSRLRANLVNQKALFDLALGLNMDQLIQLGEGEVKSGGGQRPSILSDALEAVFGAIYVDSDFVRAKSVIAQLYVPLLDSISDSTHGKDPKTLLQEFLQGQRLGLPEYKVIKTTGKAHQQKFKVECVISGLNIRTSGEGSSRRSAEQVAAKDAYELACALD